MQQKHGNSGYRILQVIFFWEVVFFPILMKSGDGVGDACASLREGKMGDGMDASAPPRGPSPRPLGEEEEGLPSRSLKLKDILLVAEVPEEVLVVARVVLALVRFTSSRHPRSIGLRGRVGALRGGRGPCLCCSCWMPF